MEFLRKTLSHNTRKGQCVPSVPARWPGYGPSRGAGDSRSGEASLRQGAFPVWEVLLGEKGAQENREGVRGGQQRRGSQDWEVLTLPRESFETNSHYSALLKARQHFKNLHLSTEWGRMSASKGKRGWKRQKETPVGTDAGRLHSNWKRSWETWDLSL